MQCIICTQLTIGLKTIWHSSIYSLDCLSNMFSLYKLWDIIWTSCFNLSHMLPQILQDVAPSTAASLSSMHFWPPNRARLHPIVEPENLEKLCPVFASKNHSTPLIVCLSYHWVFEGWCLTQCLLQTIHVPIVSISYSKMKIMSKYQKKTPSSKMWSRPQHVWLRVKMVKTDKPVSTLHFLQVNNYITRSDHH